jgi:MinD-like ATPase involved in chromosome partitioning or flagellar assembly
MRARWLAVHSFKGGTGKSTITANLALSLAEQGKNVCVVDMDLAGPGIHVMFGVEEADVKWTMTNVLLGQAKMIDAAIPMTERFGLKNGKLHFIPASYKVEEMLRLLRHGLEVKLFTEGLQQITNDLKLDYLLVDTHPGIEDDTVLVMGSCNGLLIISRIDQQDLLGTAILSRLASSLGKTSLLLFNMIPPGLAESSVRDIADKLSRRLGLHVLASLPFYDTVLQSLSRGIFMHEFPKHEYARKIWEATQVVAKTPF